LVRIADALAGEIPSRHQSEALAWIRENREILEAKWDEFN
jgi:hypothetical protein